VVETRQVVEATLRDLSNGRRRSARPSKELVTRRRTNRPTAQEVASMSGRLLPRDGDVVVSKPTAKVEHEIAIVPASPHIVCATHDEAVARANQMARERHVDAWLTEDLRHFLRVASYRG